MAKKTKKALIIKSHILKPKHAKLSDKEKKELFSKYKITFTELPKIRSTDAALADLGAKEGDIIKITRKSLTAGTTTYYRGVTNV